MSYFSTFLLSIACLILSVFTTYFLAVRYKPVVVIKKVFKWIGVVVISLFTLILTLMVNSSHQNYLDYERLVIPSGLAGVELGWSYDEVLFRKGKPEKISNNGNIDYLSYKNISVELSNKVVVRVIHHCNQYDSYPIISGVACDSPLNKVESIYGVSSEISSSEDSLSRIYNYPDKKAAFILQGGVVKSVIVFDNKDAPKGFSFLPKVKVESSSIHSKPKQPKASSKLEDENLDHCAMNLTKEERLRRLALRGKVRETGLWKYSTGNHFLSFYNELGTQVANCW